MNAAPLSFIERELLVVALRRAADAFIAEAVKFEVKAPHVSEHYETDAKTARALAQRIEAAEAVTITE